MTPARFWAGFTALGLAVEAWGLSHPDRTPWTASPNIRAVTRPDTRMGRFILTAGIGAGATWLSAHLLTVEPTEGNAP